MTEQELEAIKLKGMDSAVKSIEAFVAVARKFPSLERADLMNAMAVTLAKDMPKPALPIGKELVLCGLLAAAIALLAEERNKVNASK